MSVQRATLQTCAACASRSTARCRAWASGRSSTAWRPTLALTGWVINDTQGVFIEVEGPDATLQRFLERLPAEYLPAPSSSRSSRPGWSRSGSSASRSATATTPARRPCSSCPTSPPAPIAWRRCSIRQTGGTVTLSPIAPTAARGSPSSRRCPTTGPTRPCAASPCARRAAPNTRTRSTGGFTRSPMRVPCAGRG